MTLLIIILSCLFTIKGLKYTTVLYAIPDVWETSTNMELETDCGISG